MENKKVVAFSLLAHINDNNIGLRNFKDIFIPLIKTALCIMNNDGVKSGKSIMEIKEQVDKVFSLDIPLPILKELLFSISNEVEKIEENHFLLHRDGSFQMNNYLFCDYEDEINNKEDEILEVEKYYKAYLISNKLDPKKEPSIFQYIDNNRLSLSKYFAYRKVKELEIEYVNQANFLNSIKDNGRIYNILRKVYLGSIISAYLEFNPGEIKNKVELLLDTNFILGILDLNSIEATHTCRKILEICDRLGYIKSVLPFTIEEIELLIERKANQLDNAFFQGYLDPESIYNAAKRKNLNKTQLLQISKNIRDILSYDYKINIIGNDEKFRNLAKFQYGNIYNFYKKARGEHSWSALHDTTAIAYVKEKRGKRTLRGEFHIANCWFVTNTPFELCFPDSNGNLPEIIRADEILNYLWLSNPNVTSFINTSELSELGLTRLVSSTISNSLPNSKVLRDLDDNFNRFSGSKITADDAVMIATLIASKKLKHPETLNKLANQDEVSFISKVKEYADKGRAEEREIKEKINTLLTKFDAVLKKATPPEEQQPKIIIKKQPEIVNIQNPIDKNLLIVIALLSLCFISFIWWSFDLLFKINVVLSIKNYLIFKIIGQLIIIDFLFLIIDKKHRTAWISSGVALILFLFGILKS